MVDPGEIINLNDLVTFHGLFYFGTMAHSAANERLFSPTGKPSAGRVSVTGGWTDMATNLAEEKTSST